VTFPLCSAVTPEGTDAVTHVLAAWFKNGQLEVDWQLIASDTAYTAITLVPEAESLDPAYANRYVREALEALAQHGIMAPSIRLRGTSLDYDSPCGCPERQSLILFTSYLSKASPVRCGTCFLPVPLYRLPYTHDFEHLNILQWAADYRACDTLQAHCTTGERFGESQLGRHDSALSRQGRAIASALAATTSLPTYYYLFKARGRTRAHELKRTCPACGGPWLLREPWHGQFQFRCDACRLVSSVACSLSR
jgi:predicted  nucleic acid-binding Zn ribbon protein